MIITDSEPQPESFYVGKYWANDEKKLVYVEIPKNASKSITQFFIRQQAGQWRETRSTDSTVDNYNHMVVLRDPQDRWLKSTLELISHCVEWGGSAAAEQWFEEQRWRDFHDIHLWRQTVYLHGMNTDNMTFVRLNREIDSALSAVLGCTVRLRQINSTADNPVKLNYAKRVEEIYQGYRSEIEAYYKQDSEFLQWLDRERLWTK